jgi:hypothetical protein
MTSHSSNTNTNNVHTSGTTSRVENLLRRSIETAFGIHSPTGTSNEDIAWEGSDGVAERVRSHTSSFRTPGTATGSPLLFSSRTAVAAMDSLTQQRLRQQQQQQQQHGTTMQLETSVSNVVSTTITGSTLTGSRSVNELVWRTPIPMQRTASPSSIHDQPSDMSSSHTPPPVSSTAMEDGLFGWSGRSASATPSSNEARSRRSSGTESHLTPLVGMPSIDMAPVRGASTPDEPVWTPHLGTSYLPKQPRPQLEFELSYRHLGHDDPDQTPFWGWVLLFFTYLLFTCSMYAIFVSGWMPDTGSVVSDHDNV